MPVLLCYASLGLNVSNASDLHETRALAFVEALNQSDAAKYEAFMQAHRAAKILALASADERAQSFSALKQDLGTLEVQGVMRVSDAETRVLVKPQNTSDLIEIIMGHDAKDAAKLTSIEFEPYLPHIEIADDWKDLSQLLASYTDITGVPAWAIGIVSNGQTVEVAAAGKRSIDADNAVDITDRFHWGSVTKSLTSTMAAALVAQKKIAWETRVADLFDPSKVKTDYHNVTLAELLNHRSGLPGYDDFTEQFTSDLNQVHPDDLPAQRAHWVMQMLSKDAPIYTPGKGHRYSNGGYTVAGRMLELATGKSWENLAQELVFTPLDMRSAGFSWPQTALVQQPAGHFGADPETIEAAPVDAMVDLIAVTAPAGNAHSSIRDFARYALLHLNGLQGKNGILSAQSIRYLHTPPTEELARAEPYSFGWGHRELDSGAKMQWHNGGAGSFYAEIRLIPEQNIGFVIMANAGFAERYIEPLWNALAVRYLNQ